MLFSFNFYSSFLLIFFVNGIVYSVLLLRKGVLYHYSANIWLGIFVLLCSLYIAPWMLGFAGWYDTQPYRDIIFYITFQHLFLLGPVIYFYIQSLLNPHFKLTIKNALHFLPGLAYVVYSLVIVVTDKLILHDYYFLSDGSDREFDGWYQHTGFVSMLVYLVLSLRYYQLYQKLMKQLVSFADHLVFRWIETFLWSFLAMLFLQVSFYFLSIPFPQLTNYVGEWWYFFFFSIIMYFVAISGYSNAIWPTIHFELRLFQEKKTFLLLQSNNELPEEIIIETPDKTETSWPELEMWKSRIEESFKQDSLYKNPALTLTDVAALFQTNANTISRAINEGYGMNFNDFVNNYRIEAVLQAIENNVHKKNTLLGIAYDCGFNSKATFNRAFKKHTGNSPKYFTSK